MTRYLAIDLGEKRTGLAAGDDITGLVSPLQVLTVRKGPDLLRALADAVEQHEPDVVVLGLPVNMDGREGQAAKAVRVFAEQLAEHAGRPVEFHDERLTSYAADQDMARSGRTHKQKKQVRDAVAAAAMLRDFLATRR